MRWSHAFTPLLLIVLSVMLFSTTPVCASQPALLSGAEALYQSKEYEQAAKTFSQLVDTTTDAALNH